MASKTTKRHATAGSDRAASAPAPLAIEVVATEQLTPYADNPRRISTEAIAKVAASLKEFGWRQPIVVDAAHVIVVGHTRWLAAQMLGLPTVPVHVAGDLTPDQARAYRLADNRTGEESDWDDQLLSIELQGLRDGAIDLALTGFDEEQIGRLLDLVPSPEFKEYSETAASEVKQVTCPSCGHEFPA